MAKLPRISLPRGVYDSASVKPGAEAGSYAHARARGGIARLKVLDVSHRRRDSMDVYSDSSCQAAVHTIDWLRPMSNSRVLGVLRARNSHESFRQLDKFVKVAHEG